MKVFVSDRGMGKTSHLIKQSAKTKAIIVCSSNEQADWVIRRAEWMDIEIPTPITYKQLLLNNSYGGGKSNEYLVDEAQDVLSSILGVNITEMTINVENKDLTIVVPIEGEK